MPKLRTLATLAAIALVLVVVVGSAGAEHTGYIDIGQPNTAGTANTSLQTNSPTGFAFSVEQDGAGGGLKSSSGASGGHGLSGVTANPASFGILGNHSGEPGTGAAIRANGRKNTGLSAGTQGKGKFAVNAANTATTTGNGAAIFADGGQNTGLLARSATNQRYALRAENSAAPGFGDPAGAIYASAPSDTGQGVLGVGGLATSPASGYRTGVIGASSGAPSVGFNDAGVGGTGAAGIVGVGSDVAVTGIAVGGDAGAFIGDVTIDGSLTVTSCTGCTGASIAVNASSVALHRGDAVMLVGMRLSAVGATPLIAVAPATAGRPVIGLVDRRMKAVSRTAAVSLVDAQGKRHAVTGAGFDEAGTTASPGSLLSVVTHGPFAYSATAAAAGSVKAGDSLIAGVRPGTLMRQRPLVVGKPYVPGSSVGYALSGLDHGAGNVAVFVSPH